MTVTGRQEMAVVLTDAELDKLKKEAKKIFPERVAFYAGQVGVEYGRISIRAQRTRWGSCSGKGNLNFNCLLLLAPAEVLDSVVVHELCHLKQMNHSKKFYEEIYRVMPEYDTYHNWLKENGAGLMARLGNRGAQKRRRRRYFLSFF